MTSDYLELIRQRPRDFIGTSPDAPIRLLTDETTLLELEQSLGCSLGILYQDDNILLLRDGIITPRGVPGTYIRILPQVPASPVVVLPVFEDHILLLSHYRHSLRDRVWELPRGFGCYGLTAEENAIKELREETDRVPVSMERLGCICPDTGLLSTKANAYLAWLSEIGSSHNTDVEEAIDCAQMFPLDQVKQMIQNEQIIDGFTLSALSLAIIKNKIQI